MSVTNRFKFMDEGVLEKIQKIINNNIGFFEEVIMKYLFWIPLSVLFIFSGCKDLDTVDSNTTENRIYLTPASDIPNMPFILVNKNPPKIDASKLENSIIKHAKVEWLAEDRVYFLPSKNNMEVVINYLDEVFRKFGVHYISEGTDCDDFARLKTSLSKLIISQAYQIEASPAIFTIFVFQKRPWASVPAGGGHALIAYACVDENGENKIFIWEPQGTETISVLQYPNKDQMLYVGDEKSIPPEPLKTK